MKCEVKNCKNEATCKIILPKTITIAKANDDLRLTGEFTEYNLCREDFDVYKFWHQLRREVEGKK